MSERNDIPDDIRGVLERFEATVREAEQLRGRSASDRMRVRSRTVPDDTFQSRAYRTRKMLAGEFYDPLDGELVAARTRARELCQQLNASRECEEVGRRRILRELLGAGGDTVWMQPPFYCDYGTNIELGERVFFNFNCGDRSG